MSSNSLKRRIVTAAAVLSAATGTLIGLSSAVAGPASAATLCRSYVYEQGGSGSCVKDLQVDVSLHLKALLNPGNDPVTWDGVFGPQTKAAVEQLQRTHHITADGIVGPQTWGQSCGYQFVNVHLDGITTAEVSAYNSTMKATCGSNGSQPWMIY